MKSSQMINLALAIAAGVLLVTVIGYSLGKSLAERENAARVGTIQLEPSSTPHLA